MTPKAREIMFVGSVPLKPASKVFEALATHVGDLAPRYPDGEQAGWLTFARQSMEANPALEVGGQFALEPRGAKPMNYYQLRPGFTARDLKLGPYGYAENALESYAQFSAMKAAGQLPRSTRFQMTIPGPGTSAFWVKLPAEELLPKAREAILHELERVFARVPASELAVQLDLGMEAEHEEYLRRPDAWDQPVHKVFHWTLDQMAESAAWVANRIPADVQLGFHICSIWHHDVSGGQDNNVLVDAANAVISRLTRSMTYVHIPVIPDHTERDYEAFRRLKLPEGAKLFLGLVNLADGVDGASRRIRMAERYIDDFGIAMFCGLGHAPSGRMGLYANRGIPALRRATPENLDDVLKLHRVAAQA